MKLNNRQRIEMIERGYVSNVERRSFFEQELRKERSFEVLLEYAKFSAEEKKTEKAAALYREALAKCREIAVMDCPVSLNRIASVLIEMGDFHTGLKYYSHAVSEYNEALTIYRNLACDEPDVYLPRLAVMNICLGDAYYKLKDNYEASVCYANALEIRRELACNGDDRAWADTGMALRSLANYHAGTKMYDKAEEEYREAMEIYRRLSKDGTRDEYMKELALTLDSWGFMYSAPEKHKTALEHLEASMEILNRLADRDMEAHRPALASTLGHLALCYLRTEQSEMANKAYCEALAIYRTLVETDVSYFACMINMMEKIARFYEDEEKNYFKAIDLYNEILGICRQFADREPDYLYKVAAMLENVGYCCRLAGERLMAIEKYDEALDILRNITYNNPKAHIATLLHFLDSVSIFYQIHMRDLQKSIAFALEEKNIEDCIRFLQGYSSYDLSIKRFSWLGIETGTDDGADFFKKRNGLLFSRYTKPSNHTLFKTHCDYLEGPVYYFVHTTDSIDS